MYRNIGIIGFGNMGSAIAERIESKYKVYVFDIDKNKISGIKKITITKGISDLVCASEVIILAVKPQDFDVVLSKLKLAVSNQLIISIAAGMSTSRIEKMLGAIRVVRVMPNLPARIGEGMICMSKGKYATKSDLIFSQSLFKNLGKTITLSENKMDAVTAVSGSGPGYFCRLIQLEKINPNDISEINNFAKKKFIPAFIDAATSAPVGFSDKEAEMFAINTSAGTVAIMQALNLKPKELEKMVTSKKGTTEAGLKKLRGINYLKQAFLAALKRAKELSRGE